MFVKPRKSCEVRNLFKRILLPNEEDEIVDSNLFWQRRVRNKDIIVLTKKKTNRKGVINDPFVECAK